jgi:hypothetical protein
MPATLSIKQGNTYGPGASAGAKIKVAGAYVDAVGLKIKADGVYQGGASPGTAPENTAPPTIAGTLATGQTLTVTEGTWTGTPTPILLHRWEADGIPIPGARGLTHILTVNDAGKDVVCVEIGVNSNGSNTADSNALSIPVVLGPELLIDPSFDQGTDEWNTTGWAVGGGVAEVQSPPSPGTEVYSISNAVVAGKRYQFSMVVSAISGANLRFNYGPGDVFSTAGTHTQLIDADSNGPGGIVCLNSGSVTATVTSMSVKEVL